MLQGYIELFQDVPLRNYVRTANALYLNCSRTYFNWVTQAGLRPN